MDRKERRLRRKQKAEQEANKAQATGYTPGGDTPPGFGPSQGNQLANFTAIESSALSTAWSLMAINQQKPNIEQALEIQKSVEAELEKLKKDDKNAFTDMLYGQVLVLDQLFHSLVQEAAQQPSSKQFKAVLNQAQDCQEKCLKTIETLNKVRTKVPSQRTEYVKDVVLKFILKIQDKNGFAHWEGTVPDLLETLTAIAPAEIKASPFWPESTLSLGQQLKKLKPDLVKAGIGCSSRKSTTQKQPTIITLEQKAVEITL